MPPVLLQSLPYQRDSAGLIACLSRLAGCVCLESGLTIQHEARYDILTALPSAQMRVLRHADNGQNAFSRAQQLLDAHRAHTAGSSVTEQLRPVARLVGARAWSVLDSDMGVCRHPG